MGGFYSTSILAAILSFFLQYPLSSVTFMTQDPQVREGMIVENLKARTDCVPVDGAFFEPFSLPVDSAIMFIILSDQSDLDGFWTLSDLSQKKFMNDIVQDNYGDYIGCDSVRAVLIYAQKKYAELKTGYDADPAGLAVQYYYAGEKTDVVVQNKQNNSYRDYYAADAVDFFYIGQYLDGSDITVIPPVITEEGVYVPIRDIMSALGYNVVRTETDDVKIFNDENSAVTTIGSTSCTVNGKAADLGFPCRDYDGEPYVSYADLTKLAPCRAFWDPEGRNVYISTNKSGDVNLSALKSSVEHAAAGEADLSEKNYVSALSEYGAAVGYDPYNMDASVHQAQLYGYLGYYDEAAACYDRILQINPVMESAYDEKIKFLVLAGRSGEVADDYDRVNGSAPVNSEDYNKKGDYLYFKGLYEEALKCYEKAIESTKTPVAYYFYNKGASLFFLGRYDEALTAYDKAIEIQPGYIDAMQNKSDTLEKMGDYEGAKKCLDEALLIDDDNSGLYCSYGNIYYFQSEYEEAIKYYDIAIEKDPRHDTPYYSRGYSLFYLGRYEEALESFDGYLELVGDDADAYYREAVIYSILRRGDEAISCLSKAIELDIGYRQKAQSEKDFANIRKMSEFKNLVSEPE